MSRLVRAAGLSVALGAATVLPGFLIGALALQMRADMDAGVGAVAAGVTVFFGAGALGAGVGGRLAERLGALRAMQGSVLVTAACLFAIGGLAQSLLGVFALLAVAGLANSVNQPAINLFMADAVPRDRQGLAFGIKQSAIPGAILVSGLALPILAIPLGWRATFAICGGLVLAVALFARRGGVVRDHAPADREPPPRVSRELVFLAVGAALAAGGANALSTYLVASAVDAGIEEGMAGLLAALGSGTSLALRIYVGVRADRRRDYGYATIVLLLVLGAAGYLLMATGAIAPFVAGAVVAFALGWGWPGLFNLAVVENHREAPGAATGITQSGIYVGAAAGPALYGLVSHGLDYEGAWAVVAGISLAAAVVMAAAGRRDVAVAQRPAN
jgi:predicted MFS family arabinose efflux permease